MDSAGHLVDCLDSNLLVSQFDSCSMDLGRTLGHRIENIVLF